MFRELFSKDKKESEKPFTIPESLMTEDPVNYNSVLDYLVGLSKADYIKMIKSSNIYREANAKVAKVIGIKDEPTTSINTEKSKVTEEELDSMLNTPPDELVKAFIDDGPVAPKPKKAQSTENKIEVKN